MSKLADALRRARKAAALSQQQVAQRTGVSRMALQKMEAGTVDPRLSTVEVIARSLGLELMLVPTALRPELEAFVQSGGKLVGRAPGVSAPKSIVDVVTGEGTGRDE